MQLLFQQSSAACMILLRSFSLKTARSPVPLLRRILLRIPPLLHPRMKRPFRSTSPTHPCRRLQRIPPHPEVLTDEEYLAPPVSAGPSPKINEHGVPDPALRHILRCLRMKSASRPRLQPSVSGAGNGRRNFGSLAESHQLISDLLEKAEEENMRLRAQLKPSAWAR